MDQEKERVARVAERAQSKAAEWWERYSASRISQFDPNRQWDFKIKQPEWLLDKLIPARSIGMVYGPSNSGKSHIVCDLIATMLRGETEWQGIAIKPGSVLMFSESLGHIQARMKAYVGTDTAGLPFGLYSLPNLSLDIRDIDFVETWIASMSDPPTLLIFDTLATAFSFDENDNREASKLIALLEERILPYMAPHGTIIIVHHTSKVSEGKSARGASALIGNIDYSINVMYDKKQNLTIASWEKDRWRLVENPPMWAGTMHRVPVEFENGSAEISVLEWRPYSEEEAEMTETLKREAENREMRAEVDRLVDGWPGVKYVHETGHRPEPPGAYKADRIKFPQHSSKHQEIREYLRETREVEEVFNADGKPSGFIVKRKKT